MRDVDSVLCDVWVTVGLYLEDLSAHENETADIGSVATTTVSTEQAVRRRFGMLSFSSGSSGSPTP